MKGGSYKRKTAGDAVTRRARERGAGGPVGAASDAENRSDDTMRLRTERLVIEARFGQDSKSASRAGFDKNRFMKMKYYLIIRILGLYDT